MYYKKYNKIWIISQVFIFFLLSTFYFLLSSPALAVADINQQILDLRAQIDALTKQEAAYQGTIAQKQKEADTLNKQITILNTQISKLQVQIQITGKKLDTTKLQITQLSGKIFEDQQKINQQEGAVGELIFSMYQRDKVGFFAMLLKFPTLSNFTDQAQRAQDLNMKLTQILADLKVEKTNLESDKSQLDVQQINLESLNKQSISQQNALSGTKKNKDLLLAQTKGQEARYQQLLNDTEEQKSEFFSQLQNLEQQAIQSGAYIVHVTASSIPSKGTNIFQWPFDSYILTQGYGCTKYARCGRSSGAYGGAPHNGVDIVQSVGVAIHPMAAGMILASGYNNGWGNWVAIRHPDLHDLVTLYGHMQSPAGLTNGTAVTDDSVVGYEGKTGNTTGAHLHVSVYKDFFTYINQKNGELYFNYFEGTLNPLDYL